MNRKALLAILALIAASLPELLPQILPTQHVPHALALVSFIGAIVTGVMKFTVDDVPAPELARPSGERHGLDMSAIDKKRQQAARRPLVTNIPEGVRVCRHGFLLWQCAGCHREDERVRDEASNG